MFLVFKIALFRRGESAIHKPMKLHPAPRLTMEIVADCLFDEGSFLTRVAPRGCELAVESQGFAHTHFETTQERAGVGTRVALLSRA